MCVYFRGSGKISFWCTRTPKICTKKSLPVNCHPSLQRHRTPVALSEDVRGRGGSPASKQGVMGTRRSSLPSPSGPLGLFINSWGNLLLLGRWACPTRVPPAPGAQQPPLPSPSPQPRCLQGEGTGRTGLWPPSPCLPPGERAPPRVTQPISQSSFASCLKSLAKELPAPFRYFIP